MDARGGASPPIPPPLAHVCPPPCPACAGALRGLPVSAVYRGAGALCGLFGDSFSFRGGGKGEDLDQLNCPQLRQREGGLDHPGQWRGKGRRLGSAKLPPAQAERRRA